MSGLDAKRIVDRGRGFLAGFTAGQKAVVAVAVVAAIVGGVFFFSWASRPSYAPLFTNLSASDASAITQKLTESKTPYQLADGGGTVLVPQQDVYQTRIDLSGQGLPSGGNDGFSLLDKQSLTTSEFQQQVTYQRALDGELQKTIEAIDGVDVAVVHIAVPQQSVFADDNSKPSASVLVKTRPGTTLTAGQVEAIVHLVSSSVPELTADQVTVADATGRVLNAPGQDGGATALTDARTEQAQALDQSMADSVQTMLDKVLGPGHAVVRVDADLNYDQQTTDSEQYVTNKNATPLTQSTTKETYTGSGTPVGGVLGPDNIAVPNGSGTTSKYAKQTTDTNNAVGTIKQQTTTAPGQIRRLSVAVVVDQAVAKSTSTQQINQLVSAAAGVNQKRGDTVAVTVMPFDTTAAAAAQKALDQAAKAKAKQSRNTLIETVGAVLLVVIILFVLFRRSRRVERTPIYLPAEPLPADRPELTGADTVAIPAAGPREIAPPDPAELQRVAVRAEIGELIEQQPDEVARLLRGWLADRRSS